MRKKFNSNPLFAGLAVFGLLLVGCGASETDDSAAGGSSGDACELAADYPSGPVEIIVGYPAGGGTDSVGRLIADGLSEVLDTPVNVVNRDGGGGVVGAEAMANAEADGQTLGILGSDVILSHWMGTATQASARSTVTVQVFSLPQIQSGKLQMSYLLISNKTQDS